MKKLFSSSIAVLCSIVSMHAQFNPTTNTYTLQDKDVTISNGIITACSTTATDWGTGKLIIPETLQGQTVLKIGSASYSSSMFKGLTEVSFPKSLKSIGAYSFQNNNIEAILFAPDCKLNRIGSNAFSYNKLTSLIIPRTITMIGNGAFDSNQLNTVTFESMSFLRAIYPQAFDNNKDLKFIELPINANPGFKGYKYRDFSIPIKENVSLYETNKSPLIIYFADLPEHVITIDEIIFEKGSLLGDYIEDYNKIIISDELNNQTLQKLNFRFGGCIEKITLPNSVDSIFNGTLFEYLGNIITLPTNIKSVESNNIRCINGKFTVNYAQNSSLAFVGSIGFSNITGSFFSLPKDVIREGYVFVGWKNSKNIIVDSIKNNGLTYTAQFTPTTSYTMSGKITSNNTAGLHLVLSGDFKGYRYTNSDGSFSFPLNAGRNMVLTPEKEGYIFTPTSRTITNLQAAASNLDFNATPTGTCVSGTIDIDDKNMWLQVSGDVTCAVKLQADGTYTLPLNIGRSVTIMPVKDGYVFTPQSITVNNVQSCVSGINFTTKTGTTITQQIPLEKGWNLVSVNLLPDNAGGQSFPIATLFAGLDVETIKTIDSFWTKDQADALNRLKTITTGEGYLVKMNAAGTLHLTGVENQSGVTIPNATGWMLIGCPYQVEKPLSSLFTSANCTAVKSFEGHWQPAGSLNSIQSIEPGKAYFIKK